MSHSSIGDRRRWVLAVLREHEGPLLRFAGRLLGREDAAADVVQFAFLRLCEQSPEQLQGRVGQWLFTVCRHKAIDLLRQRRRTQPLPEDAEPVWQHEQSDPAEAVEQQELYRRLVGLVGRLPESQREVIALWSEGFTYGEIARMVDRSEVNVRVLAHRAIKRLREHPALRQLISTSVEMRQSSRRESTKLA